MAMEAWAQETTQVAPSQSVLNAAKAKTLNSFVFNFSSSDAQLQRLMSYTLVGLPQVGAIGHTLCQHQSLSMNQTLKACCSPHFLKCHGHSFVDKNSDGSVSVAAWLGK